MAVTVGLRSGEIAGQGIAVAFAACIFAVDMLPTFNANVSILYLIVILVGTWRRGKAAITVWTTLCLGLPLLAFWQVHARDLSADSISRLAFSLIVIGIASALVANRLRLATAIRELEAARGEFQNFADSVPPTLWGTTAEGYCDFLNRRFTEMTGMDVTEAIRDQTWGEPFHPDDVPQFLEKWDLARATGQDLDVHIRVRQRDGSYRWTHSMGRPVRSPVTGKILRWYGALYDVDVEFKAREEIRELNRTLQQRVEERSAELMRIEWGFRTLFGDPNIGVAELDLRGARTLIEPLRSQGVDNIDAYLTEHPEYFESCVAAIRPIAYNPTLVEMAGYRSEAELLAMPVGATIAEGREVFRPYLRALFHRQEVDRGSTVMVRPDGGRVPNAFAVTIAEDGTSYSTVIDTSEQHRLHEMMLAAQRELARTNRQATVGAFSASLAQDLQEPITWITDDVAIAIQHLTALEPDFDALRDRLDRIRHNSLRMTDIISSARAKITKHQFSLEEVDLCAFLRETAQLIEQETAARRARLALRCPSNAGTLVTDRVGLQQVLLNLATNALEAMSELPSEKRVMEIAADIVSTCERRISVADNGPGIEEENLERIFDPFFTTKPGGMGMGLPVCRANVEALGSEVRVRNRPEGGAVFDFVLATSAEPADPIH